MVVSSFFISMLSGTLVLVYSTQLQKSQCEPLVVKHNFLAHQKYTNRAFLRGMGISLKRQVEELNRTPPPSHPSTVCSLSTRTLYSLHTGNDSGWGAPAGRSFFINIQLSCRPGCLIHRNKLGIAFDTGVENIPWEFRDTRSTVS